MLMIRLQRIGKTKSPSYRFVVSEKSRDTQGKSLEILGRYNPVANPKVVELNVERVKYYLGNGAQASPTVNNLFIKEGIVTEGKKMKSVSISNKRQAKLKTKIEEKKAKEAEVEAKKAEALAQEKAKAEEVVEEVKEERVEEVVEKKPAEENPA